MKAVRLLILISFLFSGAAAHAGDGDDGLGAVPMLSPSLNGPTGTFRLYSAQMPWHGGHDFGFGMHVEYFKETDFFAAGDEIQRLAGTLTFNYSPIEWLEFYVATNGFSNLEDTNAALIQQIGNLKYGAKLGYNIKGPWNLGLALEGDSFRSAGDIGGSTSGWAFTGIALFTIDMTSHHSPMPLRIHTNVGYSLDNSDDLIDTLGAITTAQRFFYRIYPENYLTYGVSFEIPIEWVSVIAEYTSEQTIGDNRVGGYNNNPQRVTAGLKIFPTPAQSLSIDLAADIGLFNGTPGNDAMPQSTYNIIAGLTLTNLITRSKAPKKIMPTTSELNGVILDDATSAPIGGAEISFPDTTMTRLLSDESMGTFASHGVKPGELKVRVSKAGYQDLEATVTIAAGQPLSQEMRLKKAAAAKGFIQVRLTDADSRPLQGEVKFLDFPKAKPYPVKRGKEGLKLKLKAGEYRLRISAPGFLAEEHNIVVGSGENVIADFKLIEKEKVEIIEDKIVIKDKVHFTSGGATIKTGSLSILNRVADFLDDNSRIKKVRVEGHTDSTGKASFNLYLSQKRARAVADYLISMGVAPSRLEAVGFGITKPIADNATRDGRALNRRVEFAVLEWEKEKPKEKKPSSDAVKRKQVVPAPNVPAQDGGATEPLP